MKYIIQPSITVFLYIVGSMYTLIKVPLFLLTTILFVLWDFNIMNAIADSNNMWFAVFWEDTDEILDYENWKVIERPWYYRNIHDFVNQKKTYETASNPNRKEM